MQFDFHANFTDGRREFEGLDSYNGAQSLLGLSQVFLIAFHAFFNREILTQAPSAKGFRVILGKGKSGSFDQAIHLIVTDPTVIQLATDLGKSGLYDLLKWALLSGVGTLGLTSIKSKKAKKIIRVLERENDDLHEKLDEAIKRAHSPVKHQGLTLHVMSGRQTLATFNEATLRYIETEIVKQTTKTITVAVSRFNARTGTGRFISSADAPSIPFQPEGTLSNRASRALVDSLAYLTRDKFIPVEAVVSEILTADGHLKRYCLHSASPP